MFLLVGGEGLRHVLRGDLVHVAGLTGVAIGAVDGAERFFAFGVCAVPGFGAVGGVCVDVVQRGFEAVHVLAGCRVAVTDCAVPFVVYEASRVAAEGDGDGRLVVVADVFGEVGLLLVGERVPRVGERLRDGEVCGAGGEGVGGARMRWWLLALWALGFSLLRCLVFVVLRVPALSRGVRPGCERGGAAGCLRQRCGGALCVCVSGWWLGASCCVRGLACLFARPLFAAWRGFSVGLCLGEWCCRDIYVVTCFL